MSQAHFSMTGRPHPTPPIPLQVRITLEVSPEVDAEIDNMAEDLEVPKGMAILRALALLKTAIEAKNKGSRIVIVNDAENSEQDIEF